MHRSYYWGLKKGKKNVTAMMLQKLSHGLGVPISVLLKEAEALVK
jgi:transcriptional regulator with XRE-family HTH domain